MKVDWKSVGGTRRRRLGRGQVGYFVFSPRRKTREKNDINGIPSDFGSPWRRPRWPQTVHTLHNSRCCCCCCRRGSGGVRALSWFWWGVAGRRRRGAVESNRHFRVSCASYTHARSTSSIIIWKRVFYLPTFFFFFSYFLSIRSIIGITLPTIAYYSGRRDKILSYRQYAVVFNHAREFDIPNFRNVDKNNEIW